MKQVGDWVSRKKSPRTNFCEEAHLAVFLRRKVNPEDLIVPRDVLGTRLREFSTMDRPREIDDTEGLWIKTGAVCVPLWVDS